jgi:hypothetical protein
MQRRSARRQCQRLAASRGGLELLDDELIDPVIVSLSMESWRRTEQWVKVYCEY